MPTIDDILAETDGVPQTPTIPDVPGSLMADNIEEVTSGHGVIIDGLPIKDGGIGLADGTGAEKVGFAQSGTSPAVRTVQDKLFELPSSKDFAVEANAQAAAITAVTGGFFSDQSPRPNIRRIPDRLFVGLGVKCSGAETPRAVESWLTEDFGAHWFERGAELFSLPEGAGYIGGMFAARATTADPAGNVAIGLGSVAWNDDATGTRLAWAGYFEVSREAGGGVSYALEIAGKNKGDNHIRNPYAKDSGGVLGAFFAGGGDNAYNGASANPNNVAIVIGKNSNTWNTGIVFDADALTGTDGVTGTAAAIKMAKGHRLDWLCDSTNLGAQILSTVSAGAGKNKRLQFADANVFLGTDSAGALFNFDIPADSVNGFQFSTQPAGAGVVYISATGADTNLDIYLNSKGTGKVRLGDYVGGAVTATGSISVKDRASGVVYKLLCGV